MGKNKSITISSGGWGTLMTIAIIAIRAFQANAEPMSQWSAWSWLLMTLPVTFPLALCVFLLVVWLLAAAFSGKTPY